MRDKRLWRIGGAIAIALLFVSVGCWTGAEGNYVNEMAQAIKGAGNAIGSAIVCGAIIRAIFNN